MCFSAAASFVGAALLLPLGAMALGRACQADRPDLLPLALLPLGFGLQQGLEGVVWLGLDPGPLGPLERLAALAYLFFALAFWPVWIPFVGLRLSQGLRAEAGRWLAPPLSSWLRRALQVLQGLCLLLGLVLWLPLLLQPERIRPGILRGSIDYGADLVLSGGLADQGRYLYAAVITVPLLLLPSARLRGFGVALLISGLVSDWFYRQTMLSVWCFFSAVLSLLVVWIVWSETSAQAASESMLV